MNKLQLKFGGISPTFGGYITDQNTPEGRRNTEIF
jgi:hypothetical protein